MRRTKVVGFSIPPEIYDQFESILQTSHQTKSEFFRSMLASYSSLPKILNSVNPGDKMHSAPEDLAQVLKLYWQLRSESKLNIIVITLGIITKNGKVLIGARKQKNDPWIENLTWVFPGGELKSLNFEEETKMKIKSETGLDVKINYLISTRIHPDSGLKPVQIVAFYFHCSPVSNNLKSGENLKKLKWVKPRDIFKYFTGSTSDEVTKFLMTLDYQ